MAIKPDRYKHFSELGGPIKQLGVADLLFAVVVVALAAGWIAIAVVVL
jgi:hypothetical protein